MPRQIPREIPRKTPRTIRQEPPRPPRKQSKRTLLLDLGFRGEEKKPVREQGYDVFIKEPKLKKFVKVTKKPISKREAEDTRAFFIDETTSRTGKIRRTKQRAYPLTYDIPRGYSEDTKKKFRTYKQKKGVRQPLQNTIIEKSSYLLDTKSEVKQINIFKKMAETERKKQNKLNKKQTWEMA